MLAFLAALFVAVSLIEIYLFVLVGQAIGALNTIGLVILISLTGAWLTKREGIGVLRRLRAQVDAGRMPTNELIDGVLILVGGIMLVVPGFITDFCGLLLLFPPSRALARGFVRKRLRLRIYGIDVTTPLRYRRTRGDEFDGYAGPEDVIDI
jgi:UPF0716 protein FxsA